MAKNKLRQKLRGKRLTLDQQYYGDEPFYENTLTLDDTERARLWSKGANYYNYMWKSKDFAPAIMRYAEHLGFSKKQISDLKKLPDWKFIKVNKSAQLWVRGYEYTEKETQIHIQYYNEWLKQAKEIITEQKAKPKVKQPTPAERARTKMLDTIWVDWDTMVIDKWCEKNYDVDFPIYNLWKSHGLKGNVLQQFKEYVDFEYEVISDAYHKRCEQAVEAYAEVNKKDLKKMITAMDKIYADIERLKLSFKAVRMPRLKKPKASDRQVENLKFLQEDIDAKLSSINPILIPGKETLFVYNVKNRTLYQYVTNSERTGFEVRGTTLYNFDPVSSKCTRLRKPEDMLPIVLQKGVSVIEKEVWKKVTTKVSSPNGRINSDCILLRVL